MKINALKFDSGFETLPFMCTGEDTENRFGGGIPDNIQSTQSVQSFLALNY